jgi:2-polyprenyl-6-methoxyphenol hydroxylase-like FAD-dependent oxidoreductase
LLNVLIIGAGPAGLFAAAELARHGIAARLVEQDTRPHRQARGTAIKPGTLEILESVGLLQDFVKASAPVHGFRLYGPDLSALQSLRFDGLDCRHSFECSLPQYLTQHILEERLVALGGRVERGITASALDADADAGEIELRHADGRIERLQPDIVIGAGGAHSVTRHAMHEPLAGATYAGRFLVADIAMPALLPHDESAVVCSRDGLLLLSPLPGGRWISFEDLAEDEALPTAADIARRVEARLGGRARPTDVAWFAPFHMHRRMASRLADGGRFLVGDAAHVSSAFGGEGLNAALHDGYDLAWKLALVLRGHAPRSLLDAYAIERAIADRHVLEVSDRAHRGLMESARMVRQGRVPPAAVADPVADALAAQARAMLDIDFAGSPLVADHAVGAFKDAGPHPGQRLADWTLLGGAAHRLLVFGPVQGAEPLAQLGRKWAGRIEVCVEPGLDCRRAGVAAGGCVLVRPDGHIGFRHTHSDTAAWSTLDRHLTTYLSPAAPDPHP